MRKSTVWLLLGLGVIITILVLAATMGWWNRVERTLGTWFWWTLFLMLVLGIVALVVRSIVVLRNLIPHYREKRFLAGLKSQNTTTPENEEEASYRQLQEKMLEAIRTLEQAPDLKQKGLPLYAVPWYLLIGASQSGKTTLLRNVATSFAPFAHPSALTNTPTQNCDWWFFNTAVILDTAGHYAFPGKGERDSAQWYRFLQLLRSARELQPINGLIIAISADALITKRQDELLIEAAELRKRIDEMIAQLGVNFPIYLLITRCDMIEGFTEFFEGFSEPTRQRVFGYVNEGQPQVNNQGGEAVSTLRFEPIAETFIARLQLLRLSIFNEEKLPPNTLRQRIFCFPEEFCALQQPLTTFVETLLAPNPYQHVPFFRGIFFTSAQQQGPRYSFLRQQLHFDSHPETAKLSTKTYFLHDFFAMILQRDQYLVKPTRRASKFRLFKHLFIFGGCALFGLLASFLLWQAAVSDSQARAPVDQELCAVAGDEQNKEPRFEAAESCLQMVQMLMDRNRQRSSLGKLVFNRSGALEHQLRQRYVEKFHTEVLAALDAGLDQRLSTGANTIPLVFLLIKRIELITQCLSGAGCPETIDKDMQPDYQLMLDAVRQQSPSPARVATLQHTYETYLRWDIGSAAGLAREQEAHAERLRRWFASKQFALRQILPWANQSYTPVTYQGYWDGLTIADGKKATQVEGAYTPAAWKQSILPFLQRSRDAVPDMESLLNEFREEYYAQYFEQWRRFLADFPRGEGLSRELRRRLAVKLLDENSPYNRILDATFEHLKPLLPTALATEGAATGTAESKPEQPPPRLWEKAWRPVRQWWSTWRPEPEKGIAVPIAEPALPAWVRVLHRYIRSESRKTYLDAMKQMREPLASDAPTEKSFQLVEAAFKEEKPSEKSSHPLLKVWWTIRQFRAKESTGADEEKVLWPLLERPVQFVWKVLLEVAGGFLQKSWEDNVMAPTKGLSEIQQVVLLYGPQGKVREFVNQFMKPFLVENESRLGQVFGEELPISPILKTLRDEKQLKPILEAGKYPVQVEARGNTSIVGETLLKAEQTQFQITCEDKTSKVNNGSKEGSEASAIILWSPGSCGEVLITVFVSCEEGCVQRATAVGMTVSEVKSLPITKRYPSQSGFLGFIKDFHNGSHDFVINDFAGSQAPADDVLRKHKVAKIKVFYQVNPPANLEKLMSFLPTLAVSPTLFK